MSRRSSGGRSSDGRREVTMPNSDKLTERERDDALREAKRLYEAGEYLAAAMRFSLPRVEGPACDSFYWDAAAALKLWNRVVDEGNFS